MKTDNIMLFVIDPQNDFMDDGALPVEGAKKDMERLGTFISENDRKIRRIGYSLDTHQPISIFFSVWWTDQDGQSPDPYTTITYDDVMAGRWSPQFRPDETLACLSTLKSIMIWTDHCLQGTSGAAVEKNLYNSIIQHSRKNGFNPFVIEKGLDPISEMYGIVHPEYNPMNLFDQRMISEFQKYDEVLFAGEAASHCVLTSVKQVLVLFDQETVKPRFTILTDCMSSIAGCETETSDTFDRLGVKYGLRFMKSTDALS
ncbi:MULTISPECIES: hypothetical protein [unclassified Paenibacillus]|uniref:hypothetical protein n=1 Tax=unclassified Paenibacillus TaxID=185978 RepID=UPI001AE180B6|nr:MULTISPECIES: hypothetical protein [unclassified Paenibacillus]MBP1155371.1 nicotinamidase-related amidase [Paenibacillus sp. PvP091]MBP1169245.1 nicotinamidase-related amidase [Paenibacillus sp. PvR098]MBP2440272.1 nicotinamidase-related amidase [Paenibacillus sp. PvP052]